jgi:hypothetical protein
MKHPKMQVYNESGSASAYHSLLVQQELAKRDTGVLPHPLYFPDLMLFGVYPFPQMMDHLNVCHFKDAAEFQVT